MTPARARERGSILLYGALALAILAAVGSLIWWADRNIETSAGVERGEANVTAKWEKANREQRAKEAAAANTASTQLETVREKTRTVFRTITQEVDKIVERPVYRNVCLDDDGVQRVNAAIAAGARTAPGEPDRGVPRARSALRWEWSIGAAQADRGG